VRGPIGIRVRNLRKAKGLTQSGLAKAVGISPAYLNLIEANKRDVGGTLVQKIAQQIGVDLHEVTGETERRLISELQEAFSDPILEPLKLGEDMAHEVAATMPDMARALHRAYRAYLEASASANAYSHRLKSDPVFSELLHRMLGRITAVRSASEILDEVPDVAPADRKAFFGTIAHESRELSDLARTLIGEFDQEVASHRSITPAREINDLLIEERNHFPPLESEAGRILKSVTGGTAPTADQLVEALRSRHGVEVMHGGAPVQAFGDFGFDADSGTQWFRHGAATATIRFQLARRFALLEAHETIADLATDSRLSSDRARELAHRALAAYLAGAITFPYDEFYEAAETARYDLDYLCQRYSASFEQVAHRLVTLRKPGAEGIPFAFLRADPSGFLSKQFPLPGLVMPNAGHACPLWAIYGAFRSMNTIVRQPVSFSDGSRYLFIAKASAKRVSAFSEQPMLTSIMLACEIIHADRTVYGQAINLDNADNDTRVGPACRLCVRHDCPQRQEPVAANIAG